MFEGLAHLEEPSIFHFLQQGWQVFQPLLPFWSLAAISGELGRKDHSSSSNSVEQLPVEQERRRGSPSLKIPPLPTPPALGYRWAFLYSTSAVLCLKLSRSSSGICLRGLRCSIHPGKRISNSLRPICRSFDKVKRLICARVNKGAHSLRAKYLRAPTG